MSNTQVRQIGFLATLICLLLALAAPTQVRAAVAVFPLQGTANLGGIAPGPDGNVWFADNPPPGVTPLVGKVTPGGAVTEYKIAPGFGGEVRSVTSGPDGNVWFTASIDHEGIVVPGEINPRYVIGKVTTGGVITEYTIGGVTKGPLVVGPTGLITSVDTPSGSEAYGITAGPDGNVWFDGSRVALSATSGVAVIGKVTPAGVVTAEYTAGITKFGNSALRTVEGPIVAGPDGDLWFTVGAAGAGNVDKITTAGAVTEYNVGGYASSITAGPGNSLWFTDPDHKRVGRITTAGAVTEYTKGITGPPNAITAGPDGNLWAVEGLTDQIASVTPSGAVTEYATGYGKAGPNYPAAITVGADRNLWITIRNGQGVRSVIERYPIPAGGGRALLPGVTVLAVATIHGHTVIVGSAADPPIKRLTVTLKAHGSLIASKSLSVPSGRTATLSVTLNHAAQRLLHKQRNLKVTVSVTARFVSGKTRRASQTITLMR